MSKCYHRQGGSGDNNLWAIKSGHEVRPENFIEFSSDFNIWGITIEPKRFITKGEVRHSQRCWITRNSKALAQLNRK